jgi:glycosyltransferase involved in cell wall biosynthesis
MPTARVSVAIPTYNRLRFLKPCLDSIRAQTLTDIELYIFDDASTESIEQEARALFGEKLTFIPAPANMGAAKNIDRALQYSYKTPYVIVFHDDDAMHPTLLEREVALLDAHPEAAFAASNISFCAEEGAMAVFAPSASRHIHTEIYTSPAELTRALLRGTHLGFSSVMYRTTYLSPRAGLDFARFGPHGDRPFLLSLLQNNAHSSAIFITNQLVNYRIHGAQDSQRNALLTQQSSKRALQRELFIFYRNTLPQPLSRADNRLFMRFSTNALLDSFSRSGAPYAELKAFVQEAYAAGLLNFIYLNHVGMRALARVGASALPFKS